MTSKDNCLSKTTCSISRKSPICGSVAYRKLWDSCKSTATFESTLTWSCRLAFQSTYFPSPIVLSGLLVISTMPTCFIAAVRRHLSSTIIASSTKDNLELHWPHWGANTLTSVQIGELERPGRDATVPFCISQCSHGNTPATDLGYLPRFDYYASLVCSIDIQANFPIVTFRFKGRPELHDDLKLLARHSLNVTTD